MPTGIYERSQTQLEASRKHAYRIGKLPRTQKQIEAARQNMRKLNKLPRTKKHIAAMREGQLRSPKARKASYARGCILGKLPKKGKQLEGHVFGDDIVEHHNDLCHGAKDPDDVSYMTLREHSRLHAILQWAKIKANPNIPPTGIRRRD